MQKACLDDISDEKVSAFLKLAGAVRGFPLDETAGKKDLLQYLDLVEDDGPADAAVLLFGSRPQKIFAGSEVKCMMFWSNIVTEPIPSIKICRGTVFEMVDQAVEFVMSRIDCYVGEAIESVQIPFVYEIPRQVVREAVVNAVAHRDYASSESVQVRLFRNRLEIWNPGRLPSELFISKLYERHSSIPGNPHIAEAMYSAGYIEKAGSGTLDMIHRCREARVPEPVFSAEEGQFVVSFMRKSGVMGPGAHVTH